MAKIPIEQQIAELTPEQKGNMKKIYKRYLTAVIVTFVVSILVGLGIFMDARLKLTQAKDEYDRIDTKIALNQMSNIYDSSLYDQRYELMDECFELEDRKMFSPAIAGAMMLFGALAIFVVFKVKYPYFSEKKYEYLKKLEKGLKQQ